MIDHINYIKTLSAHLEAVDGLVQEKDLAVAARANWHYGQCPPPTNKLKENCVIKL